MWCEPTKTNLDIHHQDEENAKSQKKIILFTRKIDKFFNAMQKNKTKWKNTMPWTNCNNHKNKNIIYEGKQLSLCKTPHEQLSWNCKWTIK